MRFFIFTILTMALTGCSVVIDSNSYRGGDGGVADSAMDSPADSAMDAPPTGCTMTSDCGGTTAICDFMRNVCVQCIDDGHCPGLANRCNMRTNTCEMLADCPMPCGGGTVCIAGTCRGCDEDRDSFFSTEPLCAALAPAGQPLDCDDGDDTVYPGAETICGDGAINDCDAIGTDLESLAEAAGVDEVGLIAPEFTVEMPAETTPFSVMGDFLDPAPGNWLAAFAAGGRAQLVVVKTRSAGPLEGWVFDVIESSLAADIPGFPFTQVDAVDARMLGDQAVFGIVGVQDGSPLAGVYSSDVGPGAMIDSAFTTSTVPPLYRPITVGKVRDGVGLFVRGPSEGAGVGQLTAIINESETNRSTSPAVPVGDGFGLQAAGGFVMSETADGNGITMWDGTAPTPRTFPLGGMVSTGPGSYVVDGPTPAGFRFYSVLPTADGIAVIEILCDSPAQTDCNIEPSFAGVSADGLLDAQFLDPYILVTRVVELGDGTTALNVSLFDLAGSIIADVEVLSQEDIGDVLDGIVGLDTELSDIEGGRELVFGAATTSVFGPELYMGALRMCSDL